MVVKLLLILRKERRMRVFENRLLWNICRPKRDVAGGGRKLRNEELHGFYMSPDVIWVMVSWRMGWAGYVACRAMIGKPDGKGSVGRRRNVSGRIILKLILRK
jgi:hypothetical protein